MSKSVVCPFCKSPADFQMLNDFHGVYAFDCHEVCGTFFLSYTANEKLEKLDTAKKIQLISENIKAQDSGFRIYWFSAVHDGKLKIGTDVIPHRINSYLEKPIRHSDKLENILAKMAEKLSGKDPFSEVVLSKKDYMSINIIDRNELFNWTTVLRESELLESEFAIQSRRVMQKNSIIESDDIPHSITPRGWQELERQKKSVSGNKAFIAMKFSDNPDRPEIQKAISEACAECGWEARTIDNEEFIGGISDEIIAKINQSKFLVADFTGQNHGVYYEAGYASGIGIPVIFTVRETDISNLHFDTKHINHISWENFDDLKVKLKNRIEAVINVR